MDHRHLMFVSRDVQSIPLSSLDIKPTVEQHFQCLLIKMGFDDKNQIQYYITREVQHLNNAMIPITEMKSSGLGFKSPG